MTTHSGEYERVFEVCQPIARNRSFTLTELLVVIAIISLLLSIALPVLSRVRIASKSHQCMTQVRIVTQGVVGYVLDNDRLPEVPYINDSAFWLNTTDEPATVMACLHAAIAQWIDPAEDPVPGVFTRPFCCDLDAHGFWNRTGVSYVYTPSLSPYNTYRRYEANPTLHLFHDAKAQTNGVVHVGRMDGSVTGE